LGALNLNTACPCRQIARATGFQEHHHFFAENWLKSQKLMITFDDADP
jgi:hypothetical protein